MVRSRIIVLVATLACLPGAAWSEPPCSDPASCDGYRSAHHYARTGDAAYLSAARDWLLVHGRRGGDLGKRALNVDETFFHQGQPWLGDVYYKIDTRPLLAYCRIRSALTAAERAVVEEGIKASARFRRRAMDRWSQTPNLMFKPTVMVAMAGLVTGERELIDWGMHRPGGVGGGYFTVLDSMLRDGAWAEAPLYPIAHKTLWMMLQLARLGACTDSEPIGLDEPLALLDYYIDSAYPIERDGRIRIASYGDGATGPGGDLFLIDPVGPGHHLHEELAAAYRLSGAARYAAFLKRLPGYRPDPIDHPPLPEQVPLPPAPSWIRSNYGLAMLRSIETPDYWTSDRAIAAFMLMSQGYGHQHNDKFGIMLHGAGRLLYPDYNAVQYENPAEGWTRNTIAHNTVMVDERDTRNAEPESIRHDFSPEVKFLAVSASGVFTDVDQTRALLLTDDYLLDLFQLRSPTPRTYDYLLHSFGQPRPPVPDAYTPTDALADRYWMLERPRERLTDAAWSLDFVLDDAAVRVTLTGEPMTRVVHALGPHGLGMLIARRADRPMTRFTAVHEPYTSDRPPTVRAVTELARSRDAVLVRIDTDRYIDYAAVALSEADRAHALITDTGMALGFRDFAYLRLTPDGLARARGKLTGLRMAGATRLVLNGERVAAERVGGSLRHGRPPDVADAPPALAEVGSLSASVTPDRLRLFARDKRDFTLTIRNTSTEPLTGRVGFDLPTSFELAPAEPVFGPLAPGASATLALSLQSADPEPGQHRIAFRVLSDGALDNDPEPAGGQALITLIGPVLEPRHTRPPVYRLHAPRLTVDLLMRNGLPVRISDDDGQARLEVPLFTLSVDGTTLLDVDTEQAFTWPVEVPASLTAHAQNQVRWQIAPIAERLMIRLLPDWTQPDAVTFELPGNRAAAGMRWHSAIGRDGSSLVQRMPETGASLLAAGAELALSQDRHLCLQWLPPRPVTFGETGPRFTIASQAQDHWTVGFCEPGGLRQWLWR